MNFLQNAHNKLVATGHSIGELVTPILTQSAFEERGVLTPEEFISAGDQLVRTSPTWQWSKGDPSKFRDFLPSDKQFLVTKSVPCYKRVSTLEKEIENFANETNLEDDWFSPSSSSLSKVVATVAEEEENISDLMTLNNNSNDNKEEEEYTNLDEFIDTSLQEDFTSKTTVSSVVQKVDIKVGNKGEDSTRVEINKVRTYNISIVYDKYYQTPRVYLEGYDLDHSPLNTTQIFEDIMQDYQNKTVTMERHPHLKTKILQASIHPCRHAKVMKKIIDQLKQGGKQANPEQYMFIFLKFIQSVIPTIDYDYTISVTAK